MVWQCQWHSDRDNGSDRDRDSDSDINSERDTDRESDSDKEGDSDSDRDILGSQLKITVSKILKMSKYVLF